MAATQEWQEKVAAQVNDEKRGSRLDYKLTAFALKKPHASAILRGPFKVRDRNHHRHVVEYAIKNKLYLWYGRVEVIDNKEKLTGFHLIDWDTVPDSAGGIPKSAFSDAEQTEYPDDLTCPICHKECSSTSGFTLHMKSHDGKDIAETPAETTAETTTDPLVCPVCKKKCSSTSGFTLHMKKHGDAAPAVQEPEPESGVLRCPVCQKKCSSTSGLTLHRKTHGSDDVGRSEGGGSE